MLSFRKFIESVSLLNRPKIPRRPRGPRGPRWRSRDDIHYPRLPDEHDDGGGCKFDAHEVETWVENGGWKQFGKNFMDLILRGEHKIEENLGELKDDYDPKIKRSGIKVNSLYYNVYHLKRDDPSFKQLHKELREEILDSTIWHEIKIINPAACIGYPSGKEWGDWSLDGELPYIIARTAYHIRGQELRYLALRDIKEAGITEKPAIEAVQKRLKTRMSGLGFPTYPGTVLYNNENIIPYDFDFDNMQVGKFRIATYVRPQPFKPFDGLTIGFSPERCWASVSLEIPIFVPWTIEYEKFLQQDREQDRRYRFKKE